MRLLCITITIFISSLLYCQDTLAVSTQPDTDNCCMHVKQIEFYYISWDYNALGTVTEEHIRNNIELDHMYFSTVDTTDIKNLMSQYCDEQNNQRSRKNPFSVYLVMDIHFDNGSKRTILLSKYFRFDDESEAQFRNSKFLKAIIEIVPNTNAIKRK
jgi:hypothetical protein